MKELRKNVDALACGELERANQENPLFYSDHEALAVILEEVEEAKFEYKELEFTTAGFKESVFTDCEKEIKERFIAEIEKFAINLASEAVQVAAMAKKWRLGKDSQPQMCGGISITDDDKTITVKIEYRDKEEKDA